MQTVTEQSTFTKISKAEFIRRMAVGSQWLFENISANPIQPRTPNRTVVKVNNYQIVFDADGKKSFLTFYAGDACEASEAGVLRISPGANVERIKAGVPTITIQYTPKAGEMAVAS